MVVIVACSRRAVMGMPTSAACASKAPSSRAASTACRGVYQSGATTRDQTPWSGRQGSSRSVTACAGLICCLKHWVRTEDSLHRITHQCKHRGPLNQVMTAGMTLLHAVHGFR